MQRNLFTEIFQKPRTTTKISDNQDQSELPQTRGTVSGQMCDWTSHKHHLAPPLPPGSDSQKYNICQENFILPGYLDQPAQTEGAESGEYPEL